MKTGKRQEGAIGGWKVRLLGEPALISPEGAEHLLERRAAELLALAAIDPRITRRTAARMLWPDSVEAQARQALRQQLLRLRKLAGADLLQPSASLRLSDQVSSDAADRDCTDVLLASFDYGDDDELAGWVGRERDRRRRGLAEDPVGLPTKAQAIWLAHRAEVARLSGGTGLEPIRAALAMLGDDVDDRNNRLVGLFASAIVPAAEGEAIAAAVAAWAAARERFGMAIAAHVRAAKCALAAGAADRAAAQAEAALRFAVDHEPDNFYRAELWWVASQALRAVDRGGAADRVLGEGREWVLGIARDHVRPEYRDSFLHRNPVNRGLLAAARRALSAP